jgi:hypothetical protein
VSERKLASNVWVGGELYEAGSAPPKEVADQITNPKAWGDEGKQESPKRATARRSESS